MRFSPIKLFKKWFKENEVQIKRKQKIIWKNVLDWSELKSAYLTVAFRDKARKTYDIFPTK